MNAPGPVGRVGGGRIEGYDLARAAAIFGMVVVNFSLVMTGAEWGREAPGGDTGLARIASLLEGRAAALFVVLAGIGLALGARRALASGDPAALLAARKTLWKRSAFLFVFGLAFSAVWPADILHFYGWYLGLGALALAWPGRRLFGAAAGLAAAFVVLLLVGDYEAGWDFETITYTDFWTPAGQMRHLFFNGFHPVVPWLAFLLLGIWLGRRDLADRAVRRRVFAVGVAVAALAETASALLLRQFAAGLTGEDAEIAAAVLGTSPMPPMPLYLLASAGTAVAVLALAVGVSASPFARRSAARPIHDALAAAGRLSLTVYVAHVLLGMGTLEALGRLDGGQSLESALAASALFYLLAVLFAVLWTKKFRRGPLEAALRRLAG